MGKKKSKAKKISLCITVILITLAAVIVGSGMMAVFSFFDGLFKTKGGSIDVSNCSIEQLIKYCDDDKAITEKMLDSMMIERSSLKNLLVAVRDKNEEFKKEGVKIKVGTKKIYTEKGERKVVDNGTKEIIASASDVTAYLLDWQAVYVAATADIINKYTALQQDGDEGDLIDVKLKVGNIIAGNGATPRLSLNGIDIDTLLSDFSPTAEYDMKMDEEYTYDECKSMKGAVKCTDGGDETTSTGCVVWYKPYVRAKSIRMYYVDGKLSDSGKMTYYSNFWRCENTYDKYMEDYDKDWVFACQAALPGGAVSDARYKMIVNSCIGVSDDKTLLNTEPVNTSSYTTSTQLISPLVESYRGQVLKRLKKLHKEEYINLCLADMMQESGGNGPDVFQASESIGLAPNTLSTKKSIKVGVAYLCAALDAAKVKSPTDIKRIKLALQGYNFGAGYIAWAQERDGGWTQANTIEFAKIHSKGVANTGSRVDVLGPWRYGDSYYTQHVLRYYSYETEDDSDVTTVGTAAKMSLNEREKWLFPSGFPTSSAQMNKYTVQVRVNILNEKGKSTTMVLTVHKKLANEIKAAFNDMKEAKFRIIPTATSCYNWRPMASGTGSTSHHSYATAVDVNCSHNGASYTSYWPYKPGKDRYAVTSDIVKIWKKHGFYWGGDWSPSYFDPMHFTYLNH